MLTIKDIIASVRLRQFLHRPSLYPVSLPHIRNYTLEWWKENGEPSVAYFRSENNGLAIIRAMRLLGIKGKLTKGKLSEAGNHKRVSLKTLQGKELLVRYK